MKYRIHWINRRLHKQYPPTEIEAVEVSPLGSWMTFRDENGRILLGANDKQIRYTEQIE